MTKVTQHRTELGSDRWIAAEVRGSGPPVLLLHGIPGVGGTWNEVAGRLAAGHRVIVPDLLGFGRSARTDAIEALWADGQTEAVLALVDDLGLEQLLLVGHDFGGPIAAHLLSRAPERVAGLVLASTNAFGDTPLPFPLSGILWPGVGAAWEAMLFSAPSLRMMVRQGFGKGSPRPDPRIHVGDRAQARAIRTIFATALRELAARYQPITEMLRGVRVPTRVLWGDRDPFFPVAQATRTADLIPGASVTVLPGAGHFLPEERPLELAEAIAALAAEVAVR